MKTTKLIALASLLHLFYHAKGQTYAPAPNNGSTDSEFHWIRKTAFGENENIIAQSKTFFDFNGQALQTQTKSFSTQHVLAAQSINDLYGRPAIQTLAAPINSSEFNYKPDFVRNAAGSAYNTTNFDVIDKPNNIDKLNNPDALDATQIGTLGWYYSNNNTWDKTVPATAFPYSRTDYFNDGTSAPARQAGIGDELRMGKTHETVSNTFPVVSELDFYLTVRNQFFNNTATGQAGQNNLNGNVVQTISKDAQGNWAMAITDNSGKTLMTALPGTTITANNTVTLNNYKEEYNLNYSPLNLTLTQIKIVGAGKLLVYKNGVLQATQAMASTYIISDVTASNPNYRFLSDKPFTISYAKAVPTLNTTTIPNTTTIVEFPVCENCHSQIQAGSVVGQNYHYFALTKTTNLTITGGTVNITDLLSKTELFKNQATTVSLPAGMYKLNAVSGMPVVNYVNTWGDINYNFYDLKGQLIANFPPNGVAQALANGQPPSNVGLVPFITLYEYDRQGRLIAVDNKSETGRSEFIYRKDGNIRFSQNAEQRKTGKFSYTNYDNIARPTESGEYLPATAGDITFTIAKTNYALIENITSNGGLTLGTKADWVRTHYDIPNNSHGLLGYNQDYVENAVSYTEGPNSKTWYSYDEQGKVTWIIKWINGLGYKTIDYAYNYVGNVTKVIYQSNTSAERFIHEYEYDADGRLITVYTQANYSDKKLRARYYYYLHGPLKRIELGDKVQGLDYVYTAQGLLKSINQIFGNPNDDPGKDGTNGFAPDAFALQLEYFNNDYSRSGVNIGSMSTGQPSYYNGNVTGLSWRSNKPASVVSMLGTSIQSPTMYTYVYDKKYQLNSATWGAPSPASYSFSPTTQFAEKNITYDANGNLKGLQRTNNLGQLSDDFSKYQYLPNSNKLSSVGNTANPAAYATYTYDDLGQLKTQTKTGSPFTFNLKYDVTGKITGIYADAALTQLKVSYWYDENGNRIARTDNTGPTPQTTYTVYDASGNPLAMYNGNSYPSEIPIYGSERLGTLTTANNSYQYELRDNVGSVRVVISDTKTPTGQANVFTYNDYYPYGSIARSGGTTYRYEYQGAYAEKDPITGFNNFDLRMYDGRIGRWLSTDPNAQYYSPYVGMGNNPVSRSDPDGGLDDITFNTGTGTTTIVKTNDDFDRYFVDNKYQGWAEKGGGGLMWDDLTSIGFGNIFTPYGNFNRGYISNTVFVTPSSFGGEAAFAKSYVGTDFRPYSMSDKVGTIDCSRFTREVAANAGYGIPRNAFQQAKWYRANGSWTSQIGEIQNGDHLFWLRGVNAYHTGIAVITESGILTAVQANVNNHLSPSIHQFKIRKDGTMAGFGQPFVGAGRP